MTTSAIIVNTNTQDPPLRPERIYVGIDLGYREHVAAATPLAAFNPQHRPEGWKRVKTLKFTSDAAGYQRLKRYLDRLSIDSADFLVLLEPTGGYYGLSLILFLLGKGYRVIAWGVRRTFARNSACPGGSARSRERGANFAQNSAAHPLMGNNSD